MINKSIDIIDPNILLSLINTKLRDNYSSFELLCEDMMLDKNKIIEKLKSIGYDYDENQNQFK
ncbi:MAG: DUF4250 domain-containing protein [Clostridium butyricum]|nr:DUF4250 domain-containing protein [Clostridium butyricum]